MKTSKRVVAAVVAAWALAGGVAWAQQSPAPKADCPQPSALPGGQQQTARAPEKIEGQVTAVDPASGMLTLRTEDGNTHQFRGDRDTVNDYKVGDRVVLNLRSQPDC
jgi:hypothetical protein